MTRTRGLLLSVSVSFVLLVGMLALNARTPEAASAVDVAETPVAAPVTATADSAISGQLPGRAVFGDALCLKVAGNIDDTTAVCGATAQSETTVSSAVVEPGVAGQGELSDGGVATYSQALLTATDQGRPVCFWAGSEASEADYAIYLPSGSGDAGYGDMRMVFGVVDDALKEKVGRSDITTFAFNESGALPAGSILYLRVGDVFSNGSFVDISMLADDGTLQSVAENAIVQDGYVSFGTTTRGEYVLVPVSSEAAGSVSTAEWYENIQTDKGAEQQDSFPIIPLVLAIVLVVVVLGVVVLLHRARHESGTSGRNVSGGADARVDANHVVTRGSTSGRGHGKRGGLS